MYNEETEKALWAIFFAVILAVGFAFKTETLFMLRFIFDLVKLNTLEGYHNLLDYLSRQYHWHFWPFPK